MIVEPHRAPMEQQESKPHGVIRSVQQQGQQQGQSSWSNSHFYAPMDPNVKGFGLLTPGFSMIAPSQQPSQSTNCSTTNTVDQQGPNPFPFVRLTARFPADVEDPRRRTAKILEELPSDVPTPQMIGSKMEEGSMERPQSTTRRRPSYVRAEEHNSPIPYYPTISAHWDEKKKAKKSLKDCCFNQFFSNLGFLWGK